MITHNCNNRHKPIMSSDQLDQLQQLIGYRNSLSNGINTSLRSIYSIISNPKIPNGIEELYPHHRVNLEVDQQALNQCDREIEELLKVITENCKQSDRDEEYELIGCY